MSKKLIIKEQNGRSKRLVFLEKKYFLSLKNIRYQAKSINRLIFSRENVFDVRFVRYMSHFWKQKQWLKKKIKD